MLTKKKRWICLTVAIAIVMVANIIFPIIKAVSGSPKYDYVVVIDAGHGARDGGCVGANGSVEKELNLEYAKTLKELLLTKNIQVVMTRENDDALYDENSSNKKLDEMRARKEIIRSAKPDLVVSIHMNSFGLKSAKGARAFYGTENELGQTVADCVQRSMHYFANARHVNSAKGDYYILNCTQYPSILIECGYISNADEEEMLNTKEYRQKLMHSVFCGILVYLGFNYY